MNKYNQKLQDSLTILKSLHNEIKHVKDAMMHSWSIMTTEYNNTPVNTVAVDNIRTSMYTILYFTILKYRAFIDEYNHHFLKSGESPSEKLLITTVQKECEEEHNYFSIVDNTFKDLKIARDTILAHGYRGPKGRGSQKLPSEEVHRLFIIISSPQTPATYEVFYTVTHRVIETIEKEFGEIDRDVLSEMYSSEY